MREAAQASGFPTSAVQSGSDQARPSLFDEIYISNPVGVYHLKATFQPDPANPQRGLTTSLDIKVLRGAGFSRSDQAKTVSKEIMVTRPRVVSEHAKQNRHRVSVALSCVCLMSNHHLVVETVHGMSRVILPAKVIC
jgi:hypothetical protein